MKFKGDTVCGLRHVGGSLHVSLGLTARVTFFLFISRSLRYSKRPGELILPSKQGERVKEGDTLGGEDTRNLTRILLVQQQTLER